MADGAGCDLGVQFEQRRDLAVLMLFDLCEPFFELATTPADPGTLRRLSLVLMLRGGTTTVIEDQSGGWRY